MLEVKISQLLVHHNALLRGFGAQEIDPGQMYSSLMDIAPLILPHAQAVWKRLETERYKGKLMLFEGAQGAMLDVDHGTYPYVTSSNRWRPARRPAPASASRRSDSVLGISKAYTTRVGSGPFPTEDKGEVGEHLGKVGKEFGVVTGRKRRCGWFDAVLVRQAVKTGGIDGIALTKLDVLDGLPELKICKAYKLKGRTIDYMPAGQGAQAAVEPIYDTCDGWKESTRGARSWADLPPNAIKYIRRLEEMIEAPVILLSTSPEREDTILMKDPFAN